MKLGLGTVQLGLNYGIANKSGKPNKENALEILKAAYKNGIKIFDTASSYGDSEAILGEFIEMNNLRDKIKISTKTSDFNNPYTLDQDIQQAVGNSLNNLKSKHISYFLLHNPAMLFKYKQDIIDTFQKCVLEKSIDKFGVSVYSPDDIRECLKYKEIKVIQVPFNILDTRLIKTGLLKKLKSLNIEIHARSVYLQGLIILDEKNIPENLKDSTIYINLLENSAKKYNITKKQLAYSYVKNNNFIDHIFLGCETLSQLNENLQINSFNINLDNEDFIKLFEAIPNKILNPSMWGEQ